MADQPSGNTKSSSTEQPAPELLQTQSGDGTSAGDGSKALAAIRAKRLKQGAYRPSHKATFIGIAVVVGILLINGGAIAFVVKSQATKTVAPDRNQVTISSSTLSKLGVNRNDSGNTNDTQLIIGPDSQFKGDVQVAGSSSFAGNTSVNGKLTAGSASLTQLQAGTVSLNQLDVNGDATVNTLNTRADLNVAGNTRLQGPVVASQLLTVLNSVNISGNLAVGGTLTARSFEASNLQSDTTLTIGGHVITRGNAPGVSPGGALGSNGNVSISGNDTAGTVAVNVGVGASAGQVASVSFRSAYPSTPHVVVTPVGGSMGSFYINRSGSGFSIVITSALPPGGYAFDYIVMQ